MKPTRSNLFLLAAVALSTASSYAADQIWIDANSDNTWSTASAPNWDTGASWTDGNNAVFNDGTGEIITAVGKPKFTNLTFSGGYTVNSTTSLFAAGNISVADTKTATMQIIEGNKALTKSGNGTLVINDGGGSNNFTSAVSGITVNGGILDIRTYGFNYYNLGSVSGYTVNSGATLKLHGAYTMGLADGNGTTSKTITLNNGTFVAQISTMMVGDITLNDASTWTNTVNTVMVNKAAGSASTVTVSGTGLSTIGSTSFRLNGTQKFAVADTVAGSGTDLTVSSIIADDTAARVGGLTKLGLGTMKLSGANTYSGGTTITAGTLNLSNSLALQKSTLNYNTGDGTFEFDQSVATNAFTLGGLVSNLDIALINNATTPVGIALSVGNNNSDITYSNAFSGAGSLLKLGTGTLTLSGTNTYTGQTSVSAGKLSIGSNAALGAVATGAQLNLAGGATLITTATIALDNAGANKRVINLTGTGAATIDTATGTTLTASRITGDKALIKSGNGTLVFNGNAYESAASGVTVNGGTLDLRTYGGLQSGYGTNYTVNSGATLKFNGYYALGFTGDGSGTISNKVTLNNGTFISQIAETVVGDIILNNGSVWTNGTNTVMVNKASATATASTVTVSGTGLSTIGSTSFRLSGSQKFDVADTVAGSGADLTVSSIIANDTAARVGSLTKLGAGTMVLSTANTYTGSTTVTGGTLSLATASLADASTINIASGATLDLTHSSTDTIGSLFINGVQKSSGIYKSIGAAGVGTELASLTGTGKLQVTTGPSNTFANWISGFNFSAFPGANLTANGDADRDGISNLVEEIFGTAPNAASTGLTQTGATASSLTFKHPVNASLAADVTYSYQWSADLGEWKASGQPNAGGTTATISASAPVAGEVTVTTTISAGPAAKLFVRIVANQAP